MNALFQWIDDRTGLGEAWKRNAYRAIPGASWGRVWPCTIVFVFCVQVITGLFLLMHYSAGAQTAWESVYYLQNDVMGGWLLRAMHHYSGQALLVLVGIYLIQMVLTGTCRAPREFVFWMVVLMGLVVLGLLLTGDLLAWDQNSHSSTMVRTKFLLLLPGVGSDLFKLAAGGPTFGHLTLTRFLALHAVVLAGAFFVLLVLHEIFMRRADASEKRGGAPFWPDQVLRSGIACLVVLAVVLGVSLAHGVGGDEAGVALGAPADPSDFYAAARPEWAFMGLYGFAHIFPGHLKILPIFVIPGLLVALFLLMPFIGRFTIGRVFNVVVLLVLLVGNVALSMMVARNDRENERHQEALKVAHDEETRIRELIRSPRGIPVSGAIELLRADAKTQGPKLFKQHCASCHDWTDSEGNGIVAEKSSAPNLFGYGAREWVAGWLDPEAIGGPEYYGDTKFRKGKMAEYVEETMGELEDDEFEDVAAMVAALSAEAQLPAQRERDKKDGDLIEDGKAFLVEDFGCCDCHKFHGEGKLGDAPDLTGYGSREWTLGIINNPAHKRFYGKENDRMPAYAESVDDPAKNILSHADVALLTDWLRGDWYEPKAEEAK